MNDEEIKIIENIINRCSECKFATCENCEISWNEIKVIKKLLIKYKLYRKQINDAFDREWVHKDKIRKKLGYAIEMEEFYRINEPDHILLPIYKEVIRVCKELLEE